MFSEWETHGLDLELEIVPGVDGREVPLPQQWARTGAGAYGCYLSHLNVLDSATRLGNPLTLVLEDDAVLRAGFAEAMSSVVREIPLGADLVLLGYQRHGHALPVTEHLMRPLNWQRTHGYLVTAHGAPRAFGALHRRQGHVDRLLAQSGLTVYASRDPLVGQSAGPSDVAPAVRERDIFWDG